MISNHSLNVLAENIFIDKIKNKKISINKIHKYWKDARADAKYIIKTKIILDKINKVINNFNNMIISLILVYLLLYIIIILFMFYYDIIKY
jgi:hypothetical protein